MENIDLVRKDLKNFTTQFILATETTSFAVIIPVVILYIAINFNLDYPKTIIMLKCSGAGVFISLITTNILDRIIIAPVVKYFNKLLAGDPVSEEEYERAQKRFFSLPYIHSVGNICHWIFGLTITIVPFVILADLTRMQIVNLLLLYAVIPPLGGMLFFFLTEIFLQKLLNKGIFNRLVIKDFNLNMRFVRRLFMANVLICVIPIIGINGYYSIIIESAGIESPVSYLKLGGIVLFGLIVAFSVGISLNRSVMDKINLISSFLTKIGSGDLSVQKGVIAVYDELTKINQTIYIMKKNIVSVMADINSISVKLDESAHEISTITGSFSEVTQNQAATVEEVTATIEQISAGMDQVSIGAQGQLKSLMSLIDRMGELSGIIRELSQNISSASELAVTITSEARGGEESLNRMNQSMMNIETRSQQMTGIVNIITDISDKINLLSLNASIEAARAGEFGRGFAVVADEISKLADSTARSVKEIDGLIKATGSEIKDGRTGVTDVVERIGKIVDGIESMNGMVEKIAGIMQRQVDLNKMVDQEATSVKQKSQEIETATREQKTAIGEVVNSITRINDLTQTISAGSEEITANTVENAKVADILRKKVDQFKLA